MPEGTATYQQIDPVTGLVTNEFAGHISADGLDFLAASATPTTEVDRKIRWHQDSKTGASVAEIVGYKNASNDVGASLIAQQGAAPTTRYASLFLDSYATQLKSVLSAQLGWDADQAGRVILDSKGNSNFLQSPQSLKQIQVTFCFTSGVISAGWSSFALPNFYGGAVVGTSGTFPFYCIYTSTGASINSHHLLAYDNTTMTVAVDSTINQTVSAFGMIVGLKN